MAISRNAAKRMFSVCRVANGRVPNEAFRICQNKVFDQENARQLALISRMEKLTVHVKSPPHDCTLIMNKGLSTPHNCAMHLNEHTRDTSALASVNGRLWDMHRPLVEDCELQFHHFCEEDPRLANRAYWRSCMFVLGYVVSRAFKDDFFVDLHSWPFPNIKSGSFIYDADLKIEKWSPKEDELRVLSRIGRNLASENLKFERLVTSTEVALQIFEHNRFKREQVPHIAESSINGKDVTLYRLGDHIDISSGPMISHSGLIGKFDVTAVYQLKTDFGILHRFQGVSLPKQIKLNHFAYTILMERAAKVNPARIPMTQKSQENVFETPLHSSSPGSPSLF